MPSKLGKRRAKKADLIDKPVSVRRKVSRQARRKWQRAWQPVRRVLSTSLDVPSPKGKAGRVLSKRIRAPRYFRESWAELKKVTWPSRRDTWRMTGAVFLFSVVLAIITAIADFGFSKAVEKLLVK